MKSILKHLSYVLLLAFLVYGVTPRAASAQEYKEKYNAALEAAKAKKYDEAYKLFGEAANLANTGGDKAVAQKAKETQSKIDYLLGKQAVAQENYEAALTRFEQGIAAFPAYVNNYEGKALALKKLSRDDDAIATYVTLIELGKESNNTEAVRTGETGIRDYYVYLASSALGRNGTNVRKTDAEEALQHLSKLEETLEAAKTDADVLFYKATAHNVLGDYASAISAANQALENHRGSKTDAAKIYFVLGEAYMYSGDKANAKTAFTNAAYGTYKAPAEHYIQTL